MVLPNYYSSTSPPLPNKDLARLMPCPFPPVFFTYINIGQEHQKLPLGPLFHVHGGHELRDAGVLGGPLAVCCGPQGLAEIPPGECSFLSNMLA